MGRELKFRAWYKNKMWMQEDIQEDGWELAALWVKDSPIVFMQFTGLHDKNGRGIYEGDIVEDDEHYYGKVYWSDDDFMFCVSDYGALCDYNGTHLNVIGNIHENPELLEKGAG